MYAQSGGLDASDQKEVIEGVSDVVAYLGKDLIWQGLQRLMKPPAEVLNAMFLSQIMHSPKSLFCVGFKCCHGQPAATRPNEAHSKSPRQYWRGSAIFSFRPRRKGSKKVALERERERERERCVCVCCVVQFPFVCYARNMSTNPSQYPDPNILPAATTKIFQSLWPLLQKAAALCKVRPEANAD